MALHSVVPNRGISSDTASCSLCISYGRTGRGLLQERLVLGGGYSHADRDWVYSWLPCLMKSSRKNKEKIRKKHREYQRLYRQKIKQGEDQALQPSTSEGITDDPSDHELF